MNSQNTQANIWAAKAPTFLNTMLEYGAAMRAERKAALLEGKWFYGYRADKEKYAEFQARELAKIAQADAIHSLTA